MKKVKNKKLLSTVILSFCITVILSLGMLSLNETPVAAETLPFAVEIPRDDFPVRSQANDGSTVLIQLAKGSLLYPEAMVGSWYQVPFKDATGYVHKNYVTATSGTGIVIATPGAALRSGMGASYGKIGLISKNSELTVTEVDGAWSKVQPYGSSQSGFIATEHISFPNKKLYSTVAITPAIYVITATKANLRTKPAEDGAIIATLSAGTEMTYLDSAKGNDGSIWYKMSAPGGKVGYIRSDLVRAVGSGATLQGKVIVVDPGHGSYKTYDSKVLDVGAVGASGLKEKDVNMKIAAYLKAYLQSAGATVILTRSSDVGVLTLTERAEVANNNNADLFVSVHCNSSTEKSAHGTETYYCVGNAANPVSATLLANRKAVATSVQKNLVQQLGLSNRGVKTANFTVILKAKMPAILIETAFISNSSEEKLLNTSSFQEKAAKGAYLGIVEYFGSH